LADDDRDQSGEELVALIAAAKSGDESALDTLIGSCRGYLLSLAQQEMGCDIQAKLGSSDVVQETCIRVAEGFDGFRGESRAELFGWLKTILLNNMHDARRRFKGTEGRDVSREASIDQGKSTFDRAGQLTLDQLTPGSSAEFTEQVEALKTQLAKLPDDYRRALELRNWERLSFAEIGKQLDRSEEAARKLWTRAVQALTQLMQK
jgi:RNA polymerase sigma-70 factor (ECF subfamily)